MNAAAIRRSQAYHAPDVTYSVAVSFFLHVAVFILATMGLPYIAKKPVTQDTPIAVEIFMLDEVMQTIREADAEKADEDMPEPPKPKPVYNQANSAPDLLTPQVPDIEPAAEEDKPVEDVIVEAKADIVKKKPEPDPFVIKTPPKPVSKPKPKAEPKPKLEEAKPDNERDITSLLRSLEEDDSKPAPAPPKPEAKNEGGQSAQEGQVSNVMTSSDEAALNAGIRKCWNINAGGRNARDLIVVVRVNVRRDRTVSSVEIQDMARYNSDQHYKAAADAARRALLDRDCWPLQLPPEKYEIWKSFPYTFDPSEIL